MFGLEHALNLPFFVLCSVLRFSALKTLYHYWHPCFGVSASDVFQSPSRFCFIIPLSPKYPLHQHILFSEQYGLSLDIPVFKGKLVFFCQIICSKLSFYVNVYLKYVGRRSVWWTCDRELKILGHSFIHGGTNCINLICYHSHFYSVEVQQYFPVASVPSFT